MRRLTALALAGALAVLVASPAQAATTTIAVHDFAFTPSSVTVAMGTTVAWHNNGPSTHTSTQSAPLSKWNTGNIAPGTTKTVVISWAGTFPFFCAIHPLMTGSVKVPVVVTPASGSTSTTFTITVATQAAPSGFTYDVQKKVGSGAWKALRTGLTAKSLAFKTGTKGTYAFRARLHKTSNGATSGWSPADSITVG